MVIHYRSRDLRTKEQGEANSAGPHMPNAQTSKYTSTGRGSKEKSNVQRLPIRLSRREVGAQQKGWHEIGHSSLMLWELWE